MGWETFYFVCFLVGLLFSSVAGLSSVLHLHLPVKFHLHHGPGPHVHHAPHAHHVGHGESAAAYFNFATVTAFLAWFGGIGYLLMQWSRWAGLLALPLAVLAGLTAAALVFWIYTRVLLGRESPLDPADFQMAGVLGRVVAPVRPGGTGEMVFSQNGTRRTCGVRSESGKPLPKGREVVVLRYEKGLAYVRPWDEL